MKEESHMSVAIKPTSGASSRTRNRLREHGADGFTIRDGPRRVMFDSGAEAWVNVQSHSENVSLHKWGHPGKREAWFGWLPVNEITIDED
jgi:hypothetical protein